MNEYTAKLESLSQQEREVFDLTVKGMTLKDIAIHLELSTKTVDTYKQRIGLKIGASRAADMVRYAARAGILMSILKEVDGAARR